jgi:RND family efflux transporter MFP subunit
MALARRRRVAAALAASALILIVGSSLALAQTAHETSLPAVAARSSARDVAQRLTDGSVFVPKASQRILAIRTLPAGEGEHRRSIELPGRVIADPNATGFVQTAVGGRLAPPPGGFPPLGTTVEAGQVLAYVEPSLAAIDLSSIRQAQAQLDSSIAIAERQVERLGKLIASGSVSRTQLEEAELALVGLREQRTALDDIRLQPERLVAPISGVIAHANASPGLIAESNTEVFHVIDPERLCVEALSYGGEAVSASASIVGEDGERIALTFVGAGFADGSQVQPINFRIENSGREMRPGQVVTVVAETETPTVGIAMSRDAVIRGANGQDIVYVHAAPELFEQRFVRIAPLDGVRVLIVAGVSPGERLVTQGAELLNQLR